MLRPLLLVAALSAVTSAHVAPSVVEPAQPGVWVVRDDNGQWGGDLSRSITHMSAADYKARKTLDLTNVPAEVWDQLRAVRVSVFMTVRDYSANCNPPVNGLDEAYEVVVNGHSHVFPTNNGAPNYDPGAAAAFAWYEMPLPVTDLVRGANEIVLGKAPGPKADDYFYLGIDHTASQGRSAVAFDGVSWRTDVLTIPGGTGEYMVRLYLVTAPLEVEARWAPGETPALRDPEGLVLYAGARGARATDGRLALGPGQSARVEWDPERLDRQEPLAAQIVTVEGAGTWAWLDDRGQPVGPTGFTGTASVGLPGGRTQRPSGLEITATGGPLVLQEVTVRGARGCRPVDPPQDMCPRIAAPAGRAVDRPCTCEVSEGAVVLEGPGLRCRFSVGERLGLASLFNELTATEMVSDPEAVALFAVEAEGARLLGSRDFVVRSVVAEGEDGFRAELAAQEPAVGATLGARMTPEGLRMSLVVRNDGATALPLKVAFPVVAGLVAGEAAGDYYFFPWGGGIFADTAALIRRGYGDHEALYQMMDVSGPSRGAGLLLRVDDTEGFHKTLALRKCVPGRPERALQRTNVDTGDEYKWTNVLPTATGTGMAVEYLRRTRGPGESFSPADAVLVAHPGDWHNAMRHYADWAHRVWRFRPTPSRLEHVRSMIAVGWGQDVLFRDGAYRTDFVHPFSDCLELMSWWDWSPLGPWGTPIDKVGEVLGKDVAENWKPYFVKDPVTGQMMWNNQPGDYDGYNAQFGGLPAFRQEVETLQRRGALVTLYTDTLRCDSNSKIGQAHGQEWTVKRWNGEYAKGYDVWNPCHDNPLYRQWVADTMRRVMVETGADGIRLDECGHMGWACFSTEHPHTWVEPGVSQWLKGVAETARMVREAMDEVAPGSVLTTEHPGYDYLMQYLEGSLTYDLTVQACPLRPLECNLQRFYFPECKAYELDHMGADPGCPKRFWNAVEAFGAHWPPVMRTILNENEEAYWGGEAEPLVPTLVPRVYANRFAAGDKVIHHLYNATGHTVEGPVLGVEAGPRRHVFDLLACAECPVVSTPEGPNAMVYLPRASLACLATLPRVLEVAREGFGLRIRCRALAQGESVVVCDAQGTALATALTAGNSAELDLRSFEPGQARCVKLLAGGRLVDVVAVPEAG